MLTVKQERDDKLRGIKLGVDEYMTKPFHPQELILRIKKVLQSINHKQKVG
jgi:DNA-binding response OmpR family regulator